MLWMKNDLQAAAHFHCFGNFKMLLSGWLDHKNAKTFEGIIAQPTTVLAVATWDGLTYVHQPSEKRIENERYVVEACFEEHEKRHYLMEISIWNLVYYSVLLFLSSYSQCRLLPHAPYKYVKTYSIEKSGRSIERMH